MHPPAPLPAFCEPRLLRYDDRKRKFRSPSSPDSWARQDKKEEERRGAREASKKEKLTLLKLKVETQTKQKQDAAKTKPEKDRRIAVAGADEKTATSAPQEFVERQRVRQEELEQAKAQGGPEAQPGAPA